MQEILSGNHKTLIIKIDFAAAETVGFASSNSGSPHEFAKFANSIKV